MKDFESICSQVRDLTIKTGAFIKSQQHEITHEKIEVKGRHDFVTYVDKTSEKMLVEKLKEILPESGFITEEKTAVNNGEEFLWVIDPLDGTTNFIHGLSPFSISIGLLEHNKLVMGVIYEVSLDECFYAWKNSKAYLNGKEIKVSSSSTIEDSLIATGFPYYDFKRIDSYCQALEHFMRQSHGIRRLGSAAADLAYVACGRFEAFYEYSLHPWDVAAGAFIVQQAGGKVTDFSGGENYVFGAEIIATNAAVYDEFKEIVHKFMA
jgi:myo-inositol-1(or 4)-monophosphatase